MQYITVIRFGTVKQRSFFRAFASISLSGIIVVECGQDIFDLIIVPVYL